MSKVENLIINGSGSYGGGHYDKVSIRGEGTIVHDVECSQYHVFGTSRAEENIKANSVKVLGEAAVKGNMEAKQTTVIGTLEIGGRACLEKMKILGSLDVGESINGEKATIKGSLSVKGNVEFETFESSGGFDIKGLLTADIIQVGLNYGDNKAEEMGGGKITVKRGAWLIPFTSIPLTKKAGFLSVQVIEGDEIYLENTKAEMVRGKIVKIGPGCEIGAVEYSKDFSEDKNSTVKTTKKV
ncbi:cytoplasmic protein [Bacillus sp. BRMEA1]|uniref:cytoplasmic protein n=1 Tax=Neobacillus endophyticus TaxID=2738405 RepID=UPI0015651C9C|nr:cytoplasmic protein [Neobacillus endophyticus]NRD77630.1 cytoplasmic protein [Neobacillus endophyticus]